MIINQHLLDLEKLFASRNYKCVYLTNGEEQMLTAFEDGILTPIFVFYQDKLRINIGHFWERGSGCAEIGFSEAVSYENLSDVFMRIQELREEIQRQTQIPYLDERMRWQGHFTNPDEIVKMYAKKFGYSLIKVDRSKAKGKFIFECCQDLRKTGFWSG